jgi:hypothetical protein
MEQETEDEEEGEYWRLEMVVAAYWVVTNTTTTTPTTTPSSITTFTTTTADGNVVSVGVGSLDVGVGGDGEQQVGPEGVPVDVEADTVDAMTVALGILWAEKPARSESDVLVVGAGLAGLMAAEALLEGDEYLTVTVMEAGPEVTLL